MLKKKISSTHLKLLPKDDFYKMLPEVLMSMYGHDWVTELNWWILTLILIKSSFVYLRLFCSKHTSDECKSKLSWQTLVQEVPWWHSR